MIGALVLAAGRGSRFGSDKRQALMPGGETLLGATVSRYLPLLDDIRLVLRPEDDARKLLGGVSIAPKQIARSPEAALGMGHSLSAGMRTCGDWHAAMIVLGDMPWIRPETIELLLSSWVDLPLRDHTTLTPVHGGQRGHPVIFDQHLFGPLLALEGDNGAASVRSRARTALMLGVNDAGVLHDVDRIDDLLATS